MKNILLLTDFTENTKAAAQTALILSQKTHMDLILMNTYVFYPTAENYVGGPWSPEVFKEVEEENQEQIYQLKVQLEDYSHTTLDAGDRRPVIRTTVEIIGLGLGIGDVMEKNNIDLIVMGAHQDEFLATNHVNEVIRRAKVPVMIIPSGTHLKKITEVVYATNYCAEDINAINYTSKMAKACGFDLKVVHVMEAGKPKVNEQDKSAFEDQLKKIHTGTISYQVVNGKDMETRLTRLMKTEHVGLLALLHHHHSFFGRLVTHSDTRQLLKNNKIPMLIFPSEE
ncbi:MAG TPA: universal stress protein [Mucilaginibacter sp.]